MAAKTVDKKDSNPNKKPNPFVRLGRYLRSCKSELKKITWTPIKTSFKNTGIVLVVMVIMGLFIFGLDTGLHALLNLVMHTANV